MRCGPRRPPHRAHGARIRAAGLPVAVAAAPAGNTRPRAPDRVRTGRVSDLRPQRARWFFTAGARCLQRARDRGTRISLSRIEKISVRERMFPRCRRRARGAGRAAAARARRAAGAHGAAGREDSLVATSWCAITRPARAGSTNSNATPASHAISLLRSRRNSRNSPRRLPQGGQRPDGYEESKLRSGECPIAGGRSRP